MIGLTILGVLLVNWLLMFLINYSKKERIERDEKIFESKLEQILNDKNITGKERKAKALKLCLVTDGKIAAGAYFALCDIELRD